jgi:hypothetical protein
VHLATVDCQIVGKYLAINVCQITSSNLAIKEFQIAINQNDAWPRHLAILVMSCWHYQA